jgi:hypothetical protein
MCSRVTEGFEVYYRGKLGYMTKAVTKDKVGGYYFKACTGQEKRRADKVPKPKTKSNYGAKPRPKQQQEYASHSENSARVQTKSLKKTTEKIAKILIGKYDAMDFDQDTNKAGYAYMMANYGYSNNRDSMNMYTMILSGEVEVAIAPTQLRKFIESRFAILYRDMGKKHIDIRTRVVELLKGVISIGGLSTVDPTDLRIYSRITTTATPIEEDAERPMGYGKLIMIDESQWFKTPKGPLASGQHVADKIGVNSRVFKKLTQAHSSGKPNGHTIHR